MNSKLISFSVRSVLPYEADVVLKGVSEHFNIVCYGVRESGSYQTKFYIGGA